jgi:hypothetical protein
MSKFTYKYQNYLRNSIPNLGPLYTSFVVVLEMQMEYLQTFDSICEPAELLAEVG